MTGEFCNSFDWFNTRRKLIPRIRCTHSKNPSPSTSIEFPVSVCDIRKGTEWL